MVSFNRVAVISLVALFVGLTPSIVSGDHLIEGVVWCKSWECRRTGFLGFGPIICTNTTTPISGAAVRVACNEDGKDYVHAQNTSRDCGIYSISWAAATTDDGNTNPSSFSTDYCSVYIDHSPNDKCNMLLYPIPKQEDKWVGAPLTFMYDYDEGKIYSAPALLYGQNMQ